MSEASGIHVNTAEPPFANTDKPQSIQMGIGPSSATLNASTGNGPTRSECGIDTLDMLWYIQCNLSNEIASTSFTKSCYLPTLPLTSTSFAQPSSQSVAS